MGAIRRGVAGVGAAVCLLLTGCVPAETGGTEVSGAEDPVATGSGSGSEDGEPLPPYIPDRNDFKPMLKVTSRQCYGSAGCNIGYKVGLEWMGPPQFRSPRLDDSYDVYFRVTGGDMGATTSTITVSPRLRYDVYEGFDSTGSVGDRLKVKVVRISPAGGF